MKNHKYVLIISSFLFSLNCAFGQIEFVNIEEIIEKANLVSKIGKKKVSKKDIIGTYEIEINNRIAYNTLVVLIYEFGDGEFNMKKFDELYGDDGNEAEEIVRPFLKSRSNQDKIILHSNGNAEFYPTPINLEGKEIKYFWTILEGNTVIKVESKNAKKEPILFFLEKQSNDIFIGYVKIGPFPYHEKKINGLLEDFYLEHSVLRKK